MLFVHGACHGAWCWAEHFLGFFADKGYRALAVSLRGHGSSSMDRSLRGCSGADYVNDIRSVATGLPIAPVLIGHSMGGYLVQKYLESSPAPAGVLLASMSARGGLKMSLRSFQRYPWLMTRFTFTGKSLRMFVAPERAREFLFSAMTPEADVVRYAALLQEESQRAMLDGMMFNIVKPKRITTPLLVLGAEHDGAFTVSEQQALARAYGTEAEIVPGMGHNMMLEPGWASVAERIHAWLDARGL
ncbi:MAG: alpha/beta hydrolase [Actinomycetota bacterium]|nr:alpha/beta hydrolase [Actinomycetota bacterium]